MQRLTSFTQRAVYRWLLRLAGACRRRYGWPVWIDWGQWGRSSSFRRFRLSQWRWGTTPAYCCWRLALLLRLVLRLPRRISCRHRWKKGAEELTHRPTLLLLLLMLLMQILPLPRRRFRRLWSLTKHLLGRRQSHRSSLIGRWGHIRPFH